MINGIWDNDNADDFSFSKHMYFVSEGGGGENRGGISMTPVVATADTARNSGLHPNTQSFIRSVDYLTNHGGMTSAPAPRLDERGQVRGPQDLKGTEIVDTIPEPGWRKMDSKEKYTAAAAAGLTGGLLTGGAVMAAGGAQAGNVAAATVLGGATLEGPIENGLTAYDPSVPYQDINYIRRDQYDGFVKDYDEYNRQQEEAQKKEAETKYYD